MNYTVKTDELTCEYFDSILISTRYLDSDLPNHEMELLGEEFQTPVMTAALSHLHKICDHAVKCGAFAVGMDIDHAISWD